MYRDGCKASSGPMGRMLLRRVWSIPDVCRETFMKSKMRDTKAANVLLTVSKAIEHVAEVRRSSYERAPGSSLAPMFYTSALVLESIAYALESTAEDLS
jgi:hypothetical protein